MPHQKIDTHAHFICPAYKQALIEHCDGQPDGNPWMPNWTVEAHLEFMRENNITKSILSTSSPGTHLVPADDALARRLTRDVNEFAAGIKRTYPDKFGFWAALPLPDIEATLAEIDYALDVLDADGFQILSNAHGVYPGDDTMRPVLAHLNKRRATVFVHPTAPCNRYVDSGCTPRARVRVSAPLADCYLIPMMEFFFDTTRAVLDLLLSGAAEAHPGITFIISHCGAALPALLERACRFSALPAAPGAPRTHKLYAEDEMRDLLSKQFFFDLAGVGSVGQVEAILRWVDSKTLTYGSDYPWTPSSAARVAMQALDEFIPSSIDEGALDVYYENANRLLRKTTT